jgi:outer membrane protein
LPLYTGGRLTQSVASAAGEWEAARQDQAAGKADLVFETTAAYWNLVTGRESERVLAEAIASYDAHLVDARNRERFGLAPANEVLAVQVERDQAELARLSAGNGATLAEANLVRLLALPEEARIEPTDALAAPPPEDGAADDLVRQALASRPERAALAERVKAADARAAAQKAGARPQVVVSAGYDFANPNRRIVPAEDAWRGNWDAGISASWSVFDSGRTKAAVAEAAARAEAARKALADLEQRIRLEVTERRLDVATARAAVGVSEQQLRSAQENRRVSQERYKAGVSPSSELLDAETALLRAGLSRTVALAQLKIAQAGLARAAGK